MAYPLFNIRFILLISASFIAIFSSIAIYFCMPILISHVIRTQITLSPNSGSFDQWRLNSVIDRIYLYNITNMNEMINEQSDSNNNNNNNKATRQTRQVPRLQQIGPFTFRQDREKINIKFDPTNETVIYNQKKKWTFLPELSEAKSEDAMDAMRINHISVPLAGTTLNPEYGEFIDPIVSENDLRLFASNSVNALLFGGYFDLLMEQAKASGQVDVDRFGWMHNQNNSVSKTIRVFTGPSNSTLYKFGAVDQYDFKTQFNVWHNNNSEPRDFNNVQCNNFRLSSAGEFFPPPEDSIISHNHRYYYGQQQVNDISEPKTNDDDDSYSSAQSIVSSLSLQTEKNQIKSFNSNNSPPPTTTDAKRQSQAQTGPKLVKNHKKIGKSIALFMPDLCRTITLVYNGSYNYHEELMVDRYIANEYTYVYPQQPTPKTTSDNNNKIDNNHNKQVESNACYCNYNENTKTTSCPPNGLLDLFSCHKGSSVKISFPHFLYSQTDKSLEPMLRLFQDDVEANPVEHQFFIDLESTLNVPVNVQIVLQFNVHIRNEQSMNWTKEYAFLFEDPASEKHEQARDLYLPQMWIQSRAQIDEANLTNLKFIQKHLNKVTPITTIVIFGFASILLMASAKLAYDLAYGPNSLVGRKSLTCDHESCSSLNGAHQCSYLDEKKKYLDMQLLGNESYKSNNNNSSFKAFGNNNLMDQSAGALDQPSTSKKASNNFVISPSSLSNDRGDCESQPLNG